MEFIEQFIDGILHVFHLIIGWSVDFYGLYKYFVLLKFPLAALAILIANATVSATRVRGMQKDKKLYWLHSLLLVILTGFGGGCMGPMMLGKFD